MCGLSAIWAYGERAAPPAMTEEAAICGRMACRGPDGAGSWAGSGGRLRLGHRRLAVVDLDPRSAQPMASGCGRYVISYNGEIYNYPELRRDLVAAGVRLRTTSDTEVLLELVARHGLSALRRLRGMFAFALWDAREEVLWLGRDSYGIKPLYYHDDGGTVRAASQVRALLAGGRIERRIEPAGLAGFHLWGSVPEPFTHVEGILAVPPGHVIRIGRRGPGVPEPFLDLAELYAAPAAARPDEGEVRRAVLDSIERHLTADVPVGIFLSSGIDSAALLAGIHALDPARAAETVCVTLGFPEFQGTAGDELPLAARLCATFGGRHRPRMVAREEFEADLPRVLDDMDQPSIDGVNSWLVSKAAREAGLKVALSGIGGDELFGGYSSFRDIPRIQRVVSTLSALPGLDRTWRRALDALDRAGMERRPKLAGLLAHGGSWSGAYLLRRALYLPEELDRVLGPEVAAAGLARLFPLEGLEALLAAAPREEVPRVSLLESSLYMRNQLLRDTDWASMAHSIEVRAPLVDVGLLRDIRPMQAGLRGKAILARALRLPPEIRNRPKTGFTTPVGRWIGGIHGAPGRGEPWARRWARVVAREFFGQDEVAPPGGPADLAAVG